MDATPAHAFWFRRTKPKPPAEEQVSKPQEKVVEKAPRRRWWQFRKAKPAKPPEEQVVKPQEKSAEKVLEKAPRRRWWQFRRKKPAKPAQKQAVEKARDLRYHLRIPDKAFEKELLDLFARRRKNIEQLALLRDMLADKNRALSEINAKQLAQFDMKPDVLYEYDPTNRSIYVVGSMAARRVDAARKLHLQLVMGEQVNRFVVLNTGKHLVLEQIRSLGLLIAEKQAEGQRVSEALEARFAIRSDRNYVYELDTMRLSELHSAPGIADTIRPEILIQVDSPAP